MRFGFTHHPAEHYSRHVWLVQEAQRLGYQHAWIPDQTFHRDPYVLLGILGRETRTIQLGLGVTNPYTRHPAVTARAIATVGEFAPGRVTLGIGAGNPREVVQALGLSDGHQAGRVSEMVEIVRALLDGQTVNHTGTHFEVNHVSLDFDVADRIPLFVAARGPRMLSVAGRLADGVIIGSIATPQGWDHAWRLVEAGLRDSGRSRSQIQLVSWLSCSVTDDRAGALDRQKPRVARIIGSTPLESLEGFGLDVDTALSIKQAFNRDGAAGAARHVTQAFLDAFTIIGPAPYCRDRLAELAEFGIDQATLLLPAGASIDEHHHTLRTFAHAVSLST